MTKQTNEREVRAAVGIIAAVGDCIRELREVPEGHLYATLMGSMTLQQFQRIIDTLISCQVVKRENFLLTWVGPQKDGL